MRRWNSQLGHTLRLRTNFSRMSVCPQFSHFSHASGGISCFSRRGCRGFFSLRNHAIGSNVPASPFYFKATADYEQLNYLTTELRTDMGGRPVSFRRWGGSTLLFRHLPALRGS